MLLGRKFGNFLIPIPNISTFKKISLDKNSLHFEDGVLVEFTMSGHHAKIEKIFPKSNDNEKISSILFLHQISDSWNREVQKQEKIFKNFSEKFLPSEKNIPAHFLFSNTEDLEDSTKNNPEVSWYEILKNEKNFERISLKNWFTFTIDGRDAKDLDDAVSIAQYKNGDFLLGVHIADVSYFVGEKTAIDMEAYHRGTSIYLPEKVIPMLPEILSNSLCSLNVGTEKLTLSVIMRVDGKTGKVLHTDIFPSIIQSQHRGIYEEIFTNFSEKKFTDKKLEKSVNLSFELFLLLKKRRKKEGKISFETTEFCFEIEKNEVVSIKKRERNNAHLLIEEFMVLANEEVAKWCKKRKIPFLSRVHHEPNEDATNRIHTII